MHTIDFIIFWAYLFVILGVGIFMSRSVKNLTDYAVGGRSYSSFFVFATLSASFIGGGFTMGLSEKVFSTGILYVVALWGFSFKEILVAKIIAPRMHAFSHAISVGHIMGQLYGKHARIATGIAGALVCAGIAGAQFSAFGYVVNLFLGISPSIGVLIGALVVVTYSTLGGMKAVVANDTIHFLVLIIALPLVFLFGVSMVGGFDILFSQIPVSHIALPTQSMSVLPILGLFLSFFFGETLVPPYVQRLLIGKTAQATIRGTLWGGILSVPFFLMMGFIGLIALALDSSISPYTALPYVIQTVMPIGLKGIAIAGIMAVIMSSADSFLNAASVSLIHDVVKPIRNTITSHKEMQWIRMATLGMGVCGVAFAISTASVIDILLYAYNFWTPFILVPLVAGILGYRASPKAFWVSSGFGILGMLAWNVFGISSIDGALVGIAFNFLTFMIFTQIVEKNKLLPAMEDNMVLEVERNVS